MEIFINNHASIPIYEQISSQIKALIINGELKNNSASQFLREIKAKISDKKTDFRDYSNKENIKDNFDFLRLALNKKTA